MSTEPLSSAPALSAAELAGAPAWVRDGSPEVQRGYAMGVEFEQLLTQQMTSAMNATAGLGETEGGEEEGSSATPGAGVFSTLLSGALSQGATAAGGLGVAAELARDIQSQSGSASTQARSGSLPLSTGGAPQTSSGGTAA